MRKSETNNGFLSFLEKIIRAHPAIYIIFRFLIRFTNIFEKDFDGLKLLNFTKKVNILDIGASDGIATKFFNKNLNTGTIYCFEPNIYYQKILKKIKTKNVIIKPFAIGEKASETKVFFPRYRVFNKNFDIITYTHYDKRLMNHFLLDFKFRKNLSIVTDKLFIKKFDEFNKIIHLIKIDTNGYELSIIKGLIKTIKKDKPALIIEDNKDGKIIDKILKKYSYRPFYYSINLKKFIKNKTKNSLNKYYLQRTHFSINVNTYK